MTFVVRKLEKEINDKESSTKEKGKNKREKKLKIGDRVNIRNPRNWQSSSGILCRIGKEYVTVETRKGKERKGSKEVLQYEKGQVVIGRGSFRISKDEWRRVGEEGDSRVWTLKTTAEGGTKLDFEDFKDKTSNYFVQNKKDGADIAHLVSEREDPIFQEPLEPTGDDAKKTLNMRRYEIQLDVFLKEKKDTRGIRKPFYHLGERVRRDKRLIDVQSWFSQSQHGQGSKLDAKEFAFYCGRLRRQKAYRTLFRWYVGENSTYQTGQFTSKGLHSYVRNT